MLFEQFIQIKNTDEKIFPTKARKLRPREMFMLMTIVTSCEHSGKPLSPSELSAITNTSKAFISQILKKLEDEEMIQRTTCPEDRRLVQILPTEDGACLCKSMKQPFMESINAALDMMEPEEKEQFLHLAGIFMRNLKQVLKEHKDSHCCHEDLC